MFVYNFQIRLSFLIIPLAIATLVFGQGAFRPPSIPAIIAILRYQNSPCSTDSNTPGTCLAQNECLTRQGTPDGTCASGFASCCNFKFTCGGRTKENETIFVNHLYPRTDNGTNTCQVTIDKQPNVCQLRLDFEEFSLAQPDENGQCTTDSFMVRTTVGERLPILCGENNGQHLYVDMGRGSANPVVLSVVTNGDMIGRKWKVKINMIPCNNLDMAPSGCLQYFRSPSSVIQSFNYGTPMEGRARYLSNLRYTACVRVEENFCSIKWETEVPGSFSWGAPYEGNLTARGASGGLCNVDDFIGIDQGSAEGSGPGEDRLCGTKLLQDDYVIYRTEQTDATARQFWRPGGIPLFNALRMQNTACSGDSGEPGTCLSEGDCRGRQGLSVGSCSRSNLPNFFDADLEEFSLAQPDEYGRCTKDSFMVRTTVGERLPMLCGENKGQHLYVDMGRGSANPVVLSVITNELENVSRKWKIKISFIKCDNYVMAPSGCLQYYRSPSDVIRSFNYGPKIDGRSRYLANLRYTTCIRVEENFCAIKWTTESPESFSWGISNDPMYNSQGNLTNYGLTGSLCNDDDFVGIDQGSQEGSGVGEDRFCGDRLFYNNIVICIALRYTQLPCVN
ncbi:hypothetical protein QR98_0027190 [Sarcoptes scabiei]|uniref:Uncharacterized protein n=1 Tax=Sarcoptes scabiei TaxID=52283 RepID=A0A131ZZP2_SARSC|nr:hypothetical protein QR98_0027190 [Sarcoptes scabiei]